MATDVAEIQSNGPRMAALNERQQRFIEELLDVGDDNFTRAYMVAYPGSSGVAARVAAHKLAHNPKILEAMREEALHRIHAGVILATSELLSIARSGKANERLKAIAMILNRAGIHETTEHKLTVEHSVASNQEMVGRIKQLAEQMGLDPKKLLGSNIVDAEFTVVEKDPNDISDIL